MPSTDGFRVGPGSANTAAPASPTPVTCELIANGSLSAISASGISPDSSTP